MTGDLLETIVAAARRSADERARVVSRGMLERTVAGYRPNGTAFVASLNAPGIRVIAECKRRSPSRGILREQYEPATIAKSYALAGAAAISVLTEPTFFDGSLDHLRAVRAAVDVPLLRKDFIVTDYQVVEAAAAGADAVLLIVAALDDGALMRLLGEAAALGLAALVEVHDEHELQRAVQAGAAIIGVNSRNLKTLQLDGTVLDRIAPMMPYGVTAVAESGLRTGADLRRLHGAGYHAFLIGERFMQSDVPGAALAHVLADAEGA